MICNPLPATGRVLCAWGYKYPSQAKRVCSWRIWPSGGGALPRCRLHCPVSYCLASGFTFRQIIPCDWYYVAAGFTYGGFCFSTGFMLQSVLCFSRFAICCLGAAATGVRPPAVGTSARPYTAGRPIPPQMKTSECSGIWKNGTAMACKADYAEGLAHASMFLRRFTGGNNL